MLLGTIFKASRSADRGSSDCFQEINVLEQELVFNQASRKKKIHLIYYLIKPTNVKCR